MDLRKIIGSNAPLSYSNEILMTAVSRFVREIKVEVVIKNVENKKKAILDWNKPLNKLSNKPLQIRYDLSGGKPLKLIEQ
jgi:hypothetical protein